MTSVRSFRVNFEHITHLFLVFLLLTLNKYMPTGDKVNALFFRTFSQRHFVGRRFVFFKRITKGFFI